MKHAFRKNLKNERFCNEGNLRKALLVANEARMRRLPVDEIMFKIFLIINFSRGVG